MIGALALMLFLLAFFLLALSFGKLNRAKHIRNRYSVPEGKIVYTDLDRPSKAMISSRLGLVGKPDYIVQVNSERVPVEIKSSYTDGPFHNHVLQLGAYCLLIEDVYETDVPFGILVYGDRRRFKIPFTSKIRQEVQIVMKEIRSAALSSDIERNHQIEARCRSCPFVLVCAQKIPPK